MRIGARVRGKSAGKISLRRCQGSAAVPANFHAPAEEIAHTEAGSRVQPAAAQLLTPAPLMGSELAPCPTPEPLPRSTRDADAPKIPLRAPGARDTRQGCPAVASARRPIPGGLDPPTRAGRLPGRILDRAAQTLHVSSRPSPSLRLGRSLRPPDDPAAGDERVGEPGRGPPPPGHRQCDHRREQRVAPRPAHRLHRHRIASVHLSRGATLGEIEDLLNALSSDPQRGEGPVGKRLDRLGSWNHIRLRPVGYDRFELRDAGENDAAASEEGTPRDSWVELAQLALDTETTGDKLDADPLVVAEAIGRKSGEIAYDRVVLGYLARVADEMSRRRGGAQDQLALRISKLIGALDPETLRRLLEASADGAERRQFVLNASQILAADAVMEVVEAAANVSHQTISHNLLRLLH